MVNDAPFSGGKAWTLDGAVVARMPFAPMPDDEALELAKSILGRDDFASAHVDASGTLIVVEKGKLEMVNVTVEFKR